MLREDLESELDLPDRVFSHLARADLKKPADFLHRKSVKKGASDHWPSLAMVGTKRSSRLNSKVIFQIMVFNNNIRLVKN